MAGIIGIRREDKNRWERRVPLTPEHIHNFKETYHIKTLIQPSSIRVFSDNDYTKVGAQVSEDLSSCPLVFAVKEIPLSFFEPKKTYVFFSHTVKGQSYNMSMLKKMMELECTLLDYEKITNEKGIRLVFFGRYAGLAGMVDSLWAFGQRLESLGISSPINVIKQALHYPQHLLEIKRHFQTIAQTIKTEGLPKDITPLVVGFAGYGNVSKGAQEILDILPVKEIAPQNLKKVYERPSNTCLYKVVFKEKDMVAPINSTDTFDLQEYYAHPENYRSIFEQYVPQLSILMNCIYWNRQYPRLITKDYIRKTFCDPFHLQVIGDISVDINGAIEFTEKTTTPDNPVFVYHPQTDSITDGYQGKGIVVMSVDNLPCELPKESSQSFSSSLCPFVPALASTDFSVDFKQLRLPPELKKAVILHKGQLTPDFLYIDKYL